jgi:alpha-1,6-mannosyltransferase
VTPDTLQPSITSKRADNTTRPAWLAGFAMLAATLVLAAYYPFPGNAESLLDLRKLADGSLVGLYVWLFAVGVMTLGWVGGMLATRGRSFRDVWFPIITVTGIAYGALLFTYPGTAIDVYIYAARSHLLTDHGLDPSTTMPQVLWDVDPYIRYASGEWSTRPSPYGPLWNVIAAPATAFDGERIAVAVLMLKGIMIAAAAGSGVLIHDIAKRVQPRLAVPATLAWLWSPVVLWEGIANGHNDVLFAMFIVWALWSWYRGYLGTVVPLLGAAALLKVVAVVVIPAAAVAIVRRTGWNRQLTGTALVTAGLSIAVVWIAFTPFYDIPGTIEAIRTQGNVMVTSPALLTQSLSDTRGWDLDVRAGFPLFSSAVIGALTLSGMIVAYKHPRYLAAIAYEQFFWFLLLATSNLRPWYTIWLIALAAVLPLGVPLTRAAAWSIGALAAYGYTLWVQHWYDAIPLVDISANLAITLLPVLVVTVWAGVRSLRGRPDQHMPFASDR